MASLKTLLAMEKYRKYTVLGASVLINSALCVSMYFGNLSTYIYSYHYSLGNSHSYDIDPSWMLPIYLESRSIGCIFVDFLRRKIGLPWTSALGIIIFLSSMVLTYFAVTYTIWATTLTLVFVGLGNGMASVANLLIVAGWFRATAGAATAIPESANAIGGFIMNLMITSFVNPENLSPDYYHDETRLFSQASLLRKVPTTFLLIAGVSAALQIVGLCFLRSPPQSAAEDRPRTVEARNSGAGERVPCRQNNIVAERTRLFEKSSHSKDERANQPSLRESGSNANDMDSPRNMEQNNTEPSCNKEISSENEPFMTPLQVLKSPILYVLGLATSAMALGILVSNYFKLYGQLLINDDHFLAFIGSCLSLGVVPFLILAGNMLDRLGIKTTIVAHLTFSSFFFSLWYFMARLNKWLYLLWTVVIYGVHNNLFIVFSISCLRLFGRPYFSTNFTLTQMASRVVFIAGGPLTNFMLSHVGWFWFFFLCAGTSFSALIVVLFRMRH